VSGTGNAVHNARVQLAATAFNNLALAVVVAGFLAPAINGQLQGIARLIVALAWALFGFVLHIGGQLVLGRLRP
jgi:hypothetical protein